MTNPKLKIRFTEDHGDFKKGFECFATKENARVAVEEAGYAEYVEEPKTVEVLRPAKLKNNIDGTIKDVKTIKTILKSEVLPTDDIIIEDDSELLKIKNLILSKKWQ